MSPVNTRCLAPRTSGQIFDWPYLLSGKQPPVRKHGHQIVPEHGRIAVGERRRAAGGTVRRHHVVRTVGQGSAAGVVEVELPDGQRGHQRAGHRDLRPRHGAQFCHRVAKHVGSIVKRIWRLINQLTHLSIILFFNFVSFLKFSSCSNLQKHKFWRNLPKYGIP